jgi:ABC-type phosphate/phosphonate transport system substrate-binding protein
MPIQITSWPFLEFARSLSLAAHSLAGSRSPKDGLVARCLSGFRISAWLLLLFAVGTVPGQSQETEPEHPFRFAFSSALMGNANENDARAAMKVWADTLVQEGTVRGDPEVLFCLEVTDMIMALQSRRVDGLAALTSEFYLLRDKVEFNRFIFAVEAGSIFQEYVILVHADSGLTQIEDLRGRTLNVLRNSRLCLAIPWMDTLLLDKGLKPAQAFCGRITEQDKLAKTVLPVFFRQTDACLVTRKGFNTMGELNPQVIKQLRVLATSPQYVTGGFFFRRGYPRFQQDQFVNEMERVHNRPSGHQILTVFQTERLEEHPLSVLDSAIALLEIHRRLSRGMTSLKASGFDPGFKRTKTNESGK